MWRFGDQERHCGSTCGWRFTIGVGAAEDFVQVISRVSPEVVQISTPRGLGLGVVFDSHGDVITNAHVVAGGGPLEVPDSHGQRYRANLVGDFAPDDLAVVHAQ